jgi:hypothetical protein
VVVCLEQTIDVSIARDVQLLLSLPNIHQSKDVRVLNELHDDNLAFDSEQHLYRISVTVVRTRERTHLVRLDGRIRACWSRFGNDLDGCVLTSDGMSRNLDSPYVQQDH